MQTFKSTTHYQREMEFNIIPVFLLSGGAGGGGKQQTDPPSIPIIELFPQMNVPDGEILEHPVPQDL